MVSESINGLMVANLQGSGSTARLVVSASTIGQMEGGTKVSSRRTRDRAMAR